MTNTTLPNPDRRTQIVFVGGGHTHALVMHALRSRPLPNTDLTVINPGKTAPYSGMLPGFVAGHYQLRELEIDLKRLSKDIGARLIDGRAVGMNPDKKTVVLEDGTELPYDLASVDVGITTEMAQLPGFASHGVPAKPLATFAARWDSFRATAGNKSVVIIGGGIAGAEISMAMAYALRAHTGSVKVTVIDRGKVLSTNSMTAQMKVRKEMMKNGVDIVEHANVQSVTENGVVLANGDTIDANFIVGAAGVTPHGWIGDTGLSLHEGFIVVNECLQSSSRDVFAVGDCVHLAFDPRPKAGVFAVRQAPILLENLRRNSSDDPLLSYDPQSDYLKLVSLGGKKAFGEKSGWGFSGRLVWRLKNHIDQSFMQQFI